MSGNILRNWFLPKDGINRQVISADIQRYLGNDATVRPGKSDVKGTEVEGYWIKAYRNFTTEMINDLRQDSLKWDQEQRSSRRVNYEDSHTYRASTTVYNVPGTNSPHLDGPFAPPPQTRAEPPQMAAYRDPRGMYPSHPVTTGYADPSIYAQQNGGRQPPPGYGQPIEYYPQAPSYNHEPVRTHPGGSPQYQAQYPVGQYGQPQPRDPREDPRYQDYQDSSRYAYGAASTAQNGQSIYSPSQPSSNYPPPSMPMRAEPPYSRPYSQPPPIPDPTAYRPPSSVDGYTRERPSGPPGGDARRRRLE